MDEKVEVDEEEEDEEETEGEEVVEYAHGGILEIVVEAKER